MAKIQIQLNRQTGCIMKEPSLYDVIIHNDDHTTMDFVVHILTTIFGKSYDDAEALMMQVHNEGQGVAGTYFKDIAETKAERARREARDMGFPLQLTVEKQDFDLPF